jgi:hypothetical protein
MALLAFDPVRLDSLRNAMGAALEDLQRLRSDDADTAVAMQAVRSATRSLGELWLPRVSDVLLSKSMSSSAGTKIDDRGVTSLPIAASGDPLWKITHDPGGAGTASSSNSTRMYGPDLPGSLSFGEVMDRILTGVLPPMAAPLDANGRAGAHYTSLAFAPGSQRDVGHADLTSGLLKFADFMSDGLPVGWREKQELRIIYLKDARVVNSVHVLGAYDRESGPETLTDLTTEATVSGYLVVRQESSTAEVSVQIGPDIQDPTQSYPIISESSSVYSGVFYPDSPPNFQPVTREPRFVNPPEWTFTTSASPMVDDWGTWGL